MKLSLNEDLRKWFKDKWVRMDTKGNIKGDCAREPGEGKPKCLPLAKARAMDKKDRAAAARRKRREDPVADRQGKGNRPVNVATEEYIEEKNVPTNPSLWSKAKSLARSKFDVYPSAYANGWAAKWYKSKGGGWKSMKETKILSFSEFIAEAEFQGRDVPLNKPMAGDVKKSKVYVKNEKGNVVKVNFGDPNMTIKKDNPARRRSFRARHNCDNPGPKTKARYWSCKAW